MFRSAFNMLVIVSLPGISGAEVADLVRGADCRPLITIQKRGCSVETQLVCGQGADEIQRSELYEENGLDSVLLFLPDNRLIRETGASGEFVFVADLQESFATPETQLLADGKGEIQQVGEISVFGLTRPVSLTLELARTVPHTVKGGITLDEFRAEGFVQLPRPMPPVELNTLTYYHAGTQTWFNGETHFSWPVETTEKIPNTPAAVFLQGDSGFDLNIPTYDCNVISMATTANKADRS